MRQARHGFAVSPLFGRRHLSPELPSGVETGVDARAESALVSGTYHGGAANAAAGKERAGRENS